jgi:hypothetical protein
LSKREYCDIAKCSDKGTNIGKIFGKQYAYYNHHANGLIYLKKTAQIVQRK